ncbi:MAG: hypothetical protein WAV41_00765 [Microgenomates group bacterium]
MDMVAEAREIAKKNLRDCYRSEGVVAGGHHFTDYWARDGFFAALGSLEIGDREIVIKMVDLFFSFQREDGMVPYRIMNGPLNMGKYFGKPKFYKTPRPTYKLRGLGQEVLDGTTLITLLAIHVDKDKYKKNIDKSLKYLSSKEKNGLLWDGPMAEWNDAVWKWGHLLYTNIIYWKIYKDLNKSKEKDIAKNIREKLWNGKYLADWHDYKREDYLYPFGNCLAIIWGLTTGEESKSILAECQKTLANFSMETNSPKYPWWRVDILQRIVGIPDYQNKGILWWQTITAYIVALSRVGKNKEALKIIQNISQKIVDDKIIYECYERNGKSVKRKLYTAEHPFAWAAGMILWAINPSPLRGFSPACRQAWP